MSRPLISSYVRQGSSGPDGIGGPFSFLSCGPSVGVPFLCDSSACDECDFDVNPTGLYMAVHTKQWGLALDQIQIFPNEASTWVFRMGEEDLSANSSISEGGLLSPEMPSPKKPGVPVNNIGAGEAKRTVVKWRMLPIHAAIIFSAPALLVKALLKAYPGGSSAPDDQGMLPLHLAFRSLASEEIVLQLLEYFPQAIERVDLKGRLPSMLAPKNSTLSCKDAIDAAFVKGPSYYYYAARAAAADRRQIEKEMMEQIQISKEKLQKETEQVRQLFASTENSLNEEVEQLIFENAELKQKIEWYETKYDGAEEKEKVLVDHTNSLAERLRLTSLSEEHLAKKLAKLENKLKNKEKELQELEVKSLSEVDILRHKLRELEKALETSQYKADALTEKLQEKIKENNETLIMFDKERRLFEKQIDASKACVLELIASSKEDKKMFDHDSKELRNQLQDIQTALSKSSQVPQALEVRLNNLQKEIKSVTTSGNRNENEARREPSEILMHAPKKNMNRTDLSRTESTDDDFEIYVSQTRDDKESQITGNSDSGENGTSLTELTDEQRQALETLDLSGTKEEIAATLSTVPGLTEHQVNLLVEVAYSLAL